MTESEQVIRWTLDRNTQWHMLPIRVADTDQIQSYMRSYSQRPRVPRPVRILVTRELLDYIQFQEFSRESQPSMTFAGDVAKFFGMEVILWE